METHRVWSSEHSPTSPLLLTTYINTNLLNVVKQESLANAKVSARQPWAVVYRTHSLNRPSNINVIYCIHHWQVLSVRNNPLADNAGLIVIRLAVVASQTCQLAQNSEKIWTYSCSRSSKVDDFDTNRKRIYEFLLVINSNCGPILHRFGDRATYWLKIAYFSYPSLIWRPRSISSFSNFTARLSVKKLESWGYLWWRLHDPNFNRLWLIHPCDRRTDRRTGDGI